jgi:pimeloyl-ACP methyl ester carboxylesterase
VTRLVSSVAAWFALAFGTAHAQPATGLSPACGITPAPIREDGYVSIGGIEQWVTVRGSDCANPVVLIVHGGPGNPNTPFADRLFGDWAGEFTVVQWDQRGAGKTYAANRPGEDTPLSIAQLASDGVEVARYAA